MKKNYIVLILVSLSNLMIAQTPLCDNMTIYAVGNSNTNGKALHKLTKTTTGLTYDSQIMSLSGTVNGLAIADFGDGQAFYSSDNAGNITKLVGSSWTNLATVSSGVMNNPAGNGAYLYYQYSTGNPIDASVIRYSNGTVTEVWNDPTTYLGVADMAVDDDGNIYFFTGVNLLSDFNVDTLNIVSPTGNMLAQFPFTFDVLGSYGMCFQDGNMYLFFNGANSDFPSKMVQFNIVNGVLTTSTEYMIPAPVVGTSTNGPIYLSLSDIATCSSSGVFLRVQDFDINELSIYPNPVQNELHINTHFSGIAEIYTVLGQNITQFELNGATESTIDVSGFSSGIYILNLKTTDGKSYIKRFVKN